MGKTELESRREKLDVERNKIVTLARTFIVFLDESDSLSDPNSISEPISIEMLSYNINKWKSTNTEIPDENGKAIVVPSFIVEKYQLLEAMIEKYRQEEAEIIKLENAKSQPEYINKLIEARHLYPDGVRIITTPDDVACFLVDNEFPVTAQSLYDSFLKDNGERFSLSTMEKAVELANVVIKPKETNRKKLKEERKNNKFK
jgi:hypothetical protein